MKNYRQQWFWLMTLIFVFFMAFGSGISAKAQEFVTGNFYDSDGESLLYSIKIDKSYVGGKLGVALDDYNFYPVRRGYKAKAWINQETGEEKPAPYYFRHYTLRGDFNLTAVWNPKPYQFHINYQLNGGNFTWPECDNVPYYFSVESGPITLYKPVKSGYIFGGWYLDEKCKKKPIDDIAPGTYLDSKKGKVEDYTVYAKWIAAAPKRPEITRVSNYAKGKVSVKIKKNKNAQEYVLYYSTRKKMDKNVHELHSTKNKFVLTNLLKGKTYYFKVKTINRDSLDQICPSKLSKRQSVYVANGVTEVSPTNKKVPITVQVVADQMLNVTANVPKRLKSADDFYYLVKVDPITGEICQVVTDAEKKKYVKFLLPVNDGDGHNHIQGRFGIAIKKFSGGYRLISDTSFISNPQDAAAYTAQFPKTVSKKGIQGYLDGDLNVKHTFLNMNINSVLGGSTPYEYNGKTYYFNDAFSGFIKSANSKGMTVTGQVMMGWNEAKSYMILPSGRQPGHLYYAMNAKEAEARAELEAAFCFMAEHYSKPDCHLDNWILGNEVNIHQMWYYAGQISKSDFMKNYADTFRILYYAVRGNYKNARVYICTDHTWNDRENDWGAKPFIQSFSKRIKAQNKKIQWNLAYHAYPSDLRKSAVWKDADPSNDSAEFVGPKNLEVLTDFMNRNFGKNARIILSEQGFTSTSGLEVQAAALVYTFYKAQFNDMIDATIFRALSDNEVEISQGLRLGLTDEYGNHKEAYDVFKYMDTKGYGPYVTKYLDTIGIGSWSEIAPKFDPSIFGDN